MACRSGGVVNLKVPFWPIWWCVDGWRVAESGLSTEYGVQYVVIDVCNVS